MLFQFIFNQWDCILSIGVTHYLKKHRINKKHLENKKNII